MKKSNRHSHITSISGAIVLFSLLALSACGGGGGGGESTPDTTPSIGGTPEPPPGPMVKRNSLYSPVRIAEGVDGKLYVSDTNVNSVFVIQDLLVTNELKGLARPLVVAVDA